MASFIIWNHELTGLETLEELGSSHLSSVDNGTSRVEDLEVTLDRGNGANGVKDRAEDRVGNGANSAGNVTDGAANDITLDGGNGANSVEDRAEDRVGDRANSAGNITDSAANNVTLGGGRGNVANGWTSG